MLASLSLKSEPLWLQQQQRPSHSLYHPLLLLPGDEGAGVQVEAALLLAASPFLRQTILSSCCCCKSGAMTIMLPSSTSTSLEHLAQILAHGSVTIAIEALEDLSSLLTLLEVDIYMTTCDKKAEKKEGKEKWKLSSSLPSPILLSPPPTPPTASGESTAGSTKSVQSPTSISSYPPSKKSLRTLLTTPSPVSSILISIPFKRLSSETVQRITPTQENLTRLSSSEAKTASPRVCPKQDAKDIPMLGGFLFSKISEFFISSIFPLKL